MLSPFTHTIILHFYVWQGCCRIGDLGPITFPRLNDLRTKVIRSAKDNFQRVFTPSLTYLRLELGEHQKEERNTFLCHLNQ